MSLKRKKKRRMPTINQLIRKPRHPEARAHKSLALRSSPQRRGVCTRLHDDAEEAELGAS